MSAEPPVESEIFDNLIIGSGAAAASTAKALHRLGQRFAVLDVGFDLDDSTLAKINSLAKTSSDYWDTGITSDIFPPPNASSAGVERKLSFGSDHPYRVPEPLNLHTQNCQVEISHSRGGLGNVWGAAVLPYCAHSIRDWPISMRSMNASYRNVLNYLPFSGVQDQLAGEFPLFRDHVTSIDTTKQINSLMEALASRAPNMEKQGLVFGRARVAVNSGGGLNSCQYCGRCLDGCVYGSIFDPKQIWQEFADSSQIFSNQYVLELKEDEGFVSILTVDLKTSSPRQWYAKRVFCGAGTYGSTRLLARSLGWDKRDIKIADSQYFFFPLLSYRGYNKSSGFSLAEIFVEMLNESISEEYLHFQAYGINDIFKKTLQGLLPLPVPLGSIYRRFFLFQGFLHSNDSGSLYMNIECKEMSDDVSIRGVENERARQVASRSQKIIRKLLIKFGIVPPFYLKMVPPGRSFHTGGSFPMGGTHDVLSSDTLGRPAGLQRVHLVDASCFPDIPGSTILLNIMANADRIVSQTVEERLI